MAATVNSSALVLASPFAIYEWKLSSLVSDQQETLTHNIDGVAPNFVEFVVCTPATDHSNIVMDWYQASNDTSANTIKVRLKTQADGDMSGASVIVRAHFYAMASGGISA
jgi:hypothetical protein